MHFHSTGRPPDFLPDLSKPFCAKPSQLFLEDVYEATGYRLASDSPAALRVGGGRQRTGAAAAVANRDQRLVQVGTLRPLRWDLGTLATCPSRLRWHLSFKTILPICMFPQTVVLSLFLPMAAADEALLSGQAGWGDDEADVGPLNRRYDPDAYDGYSAATRCAGLCVCTGKMGSLGPGAGRDQSSAAGKHLAAITSAYVSLDTSS